MSGEVLIQSSKNAALPLMAASVLMEDVTVLENCPDISDVFCMCEILRCVGAKVKREGSALIIDATRITGHKLPQEYVTRMRSSVIMAGAMLGRCREVSFGQPGGCVIGDRPIDMHIKALSRLGAEFEEADGTIRARCHKPLGTDIVLPFPSVGATQNALLLAVRAKGTTQIYRCAREPEIVCLCDFLNGAGAKIYGAGSSHITVEGVEKLHGSTYRIGPDRIVAGTYLIGVMAAGGGAFLRRVPTQELSGVLQLAGQMGCRIVPDAEGIWVERKGRMKSPGNLETGVYPAFPTDLQAPMLVALCQAERSSSIKERIFNGRLAVTEELNRMGASISVEKNRAVMPGSAVLSGRSVTAKELRGGAALVLAGVCASGFTFVYNRHFIDRGYEDIVRDFRSLGANIGGKT